MLFITDQQTLADLSLLGKKDSVYSLFNQTKTAKGAAILEEMFRTPMNQPASINERSAMIRYLALKKADFVFNSGDLDDFEQYFSSPAHHTLRDEEPKGLKHLIQDFIANDPDKEIAKKGIRAIFRIVMSAREFFGQHEKIAESPFKIQDKPSELFQFLSQEPFNLFLPEMGKDPYPDAQIFVLEKDLRAGNRGKIRQFVDYLYELDVLISIAKIANEHGFAFPEAIGEQNAAVLQVKGLFHPLIKDAVPNDLSLTSLNNLLFLTGSNMGGKSTLLKAIGISFYLAHMGFPVPAKAMVFSVMDGVYTTINASDNLAEGASHFYIEVLRLKKIAKELAVARKMLVIFDELFRGTNVKDAFEATVAVTNLFSKHAGSFFMISTHITEASELLMGNSRITFAQLSTYMDGKHPRYTYRLERGVSAERHGMIIIQNENILGILRNGRKE